MKKLVFSAILLATASAFAFFIPLQKDGSVKWSNSSDGQMQVEGVSAAQQAPAAGDRKPAGQNNPDAYVEEPVYTPPPVVEQPPQYEEPPAHEEPPPTYNGSFSCLKAGFAAAGYRDTSTSYINSVAARSKMIYDGAKSGGFLFFGGKVDPAKNHKSALKHAIFTLSALGNCKSSTYGNGKGSNLLDHTPSEEEYQQTFGMKSKAYTNGHQTPWNPTGIEQINSVFKQYTSRSNPALYNCVKSRESADASARLCRALIRTCSDMICGKGQNCGIANYYSCDYKEPNDHDHGNGNGNNGGNNNGGNNNGGNTNGNTNGNNNGSHETPGGNNAEAGHGSDGSNNGGGQGDGPPGSH